jgi:serine protease AprX
MHTMQRAALPFLAFALLPFPTRAEARPLDKVAPWVLEKTAGGKTAEFLVVLTEQADLSPARTLTTKSAKGWFVRDALWDTARATQGPLLARLRARGAPHRAFYIVNAVWVKGDRRLVMALAARPDVARIEGNPAIRNVLPPAEGPADDAPDTIEPGISYVKAPQVWAMGFTGQGIVVGGQDTGYRWTHNALKPHYRGWNGTTANHDFNWHDSIHTGGGVCGPNSPFPCDDYFHGTHTMGTAIGLDSDTPPASNQIGMAPGAKWIGCRNMDQGTGTPATYLECFEFFLAPYPVGGNPGQGNPALAPDVTVNSWGCPLGPPPGGEDCSPGTLLAAVMAQRAAGIVTEMSAGNAGPGCSTVNDPAAIYDGSFSTGALNTGSDTLASFSSRGPVLLLPVFAEGAKRVKPDIAAPGTGTRSATNSGDASYTTASGTSMAGPHVAGAVALLLSSDASLIGDPDAIEQRLADSAFRISTSACSSTAGVYPNNLFGYGRLDILAAVLGPLTSVTVEAVGPTTVCPTCAAGTATATDAGGGDATHQWGFRTTSGGPITSIPGQTATSYVIHGAHFPGMGHYFLVEVTTSASVAGTSVVSNEVPITVAFGQ